MTDLKEPGRCDGCGVESTGLRVHCFSDGAVRARYCPGCQILRQTKGVGIDEHEQYQLRERPGADSDPDGEDDGDDDRAAMRTVQEYPALRLGVIG